MLCDNDMRHDLLDEQDTSQLFQLQMLYLLLNHIQKDKMDLHYSLKQLQKILRLLQIYPKLFQIYLLNLITMHFEEHFDRLVPLYYILNGLNRIEIKHQTSTIMMGLTSSLKYSQKPILIKFPLEIKNNDQVNHCSAFLFLLETHFKSR